MGHFAMAEVTLEKLCKSFGREKAVIDLDMSIEDGSFVGSLTFSERN